MKSASDDSKRKRRSRRANGEGSIYQRKAGRWTAAYFVPKPTGGEARRYVYGKSPARRPL